MIKKPTLYERNDERFGFIMSKLYYFFTMNRASRNFYNIIINDLKKRQFNSILDIGCGTGFVIKHIANDKNISYYGIDPSPHMIEISKKNAGIVNFELGSNRKLPKDKKFDIIFASLSFHHWPDKMESLKQILGSLKKNGIFLVYENDRDKMNYLTKILIGSHAMNEDDFRAIKLNSIKMNIKHVNTVIIAEIKK